MAIESYKRPLHVHLARKSWWINCRDAVFDIQNISKLIFDSKNSSSIAMPSSSLDSRSSVAHWHRKTVWSPSQRGYQLSCRNESWWRGVTHICLSNTPHQRDPFHGPKLSFQRKITIARSLLVDDSRIVVDFAVTMLKNLKALVPKQWHQESKKSKAPPRPKTRPGSECITHYLLPIKQGAVCLYFHKSYYPIREALIHCA